MPLVMTTEGKTIWLERIQRVVDFVKANNWSDAAVRELISHSTTNAPCFAVGDRRDWDEIWNKFLVPRRALEWWSSGTSYIDDEQRLEHCVSCPNFTPCQLTANKIAKMKLCVNAWEQIGATFKTVTK